MESQESLVEKYSKELFYGASLWFVRGSRMHAIKQHSAGVSLYYVNDTLYNGHEQDSAFTLQELVQKCKINLNSWELNRVHEITGQPTLFFD